MPSYFNFTGYEIALPTDKDNWSSKDLSFYVQYTEEGKPERLKQDYVIKRGIKSVVSDHVTTKLISYATYMNIKTEIDTFAILHEGTEIDAELKVIYPGEVSIITEVENVRRECLTQVEDTRKPTLGHTSDLALIYAALFKKKFPRFRGWAMSRASSRVNEVLSYYINCYLACIPTEAYPDIKLLARNKHVLLFNPAAGAAKAAKESPIEHSLLILRGFFGACSITKKSYASASKTADQPLVENMKKWIEKRLAAVAMKCGTKQRSDLKS
ncbi:hypothetical protein CBL_10066 [Carabus blaptoides fortunei]